MLTLALISLGLLVYTYFGYPLVLALLARLYPLRTPPRPGIPRRWSACAWRCTTAATGSTPSWRAWWPRTGPPTSSSSSSTRTARPTTPRPSPGSGPPATGACGWCKGEQRSGKPTGLNRLRDIATGEVILITDVRQPLDAGRRAGAGRAAGRSPGRLRQRQPGAAGRGGQRRLLALREVHPPQGGRPSAAWSA